MIAGKVVDTGLGMFQDNRNKKWQTGQSRENHETNYQNNKKLTKYNKEQQLDLWQKTNYGAQMEEMKKAGVNPALIYGQGGAGGATSSVATGSNTGTAASSESRIPMEIGAVAAEQQAIQTSKAQEELIKAQTEKTQTETTKIGGVDTEEARTRITSINQGVSNMMATKQLTVAQTYAKTMENFITENTQEDVIKEIKWNAEKAYEAVRQARNITYISDETIEEKIGTIRAIEIGATLNNMATRAKINLTKEQTEAIGIEIAQDWAKLDNMNEANRIKELDVMVKKALGEEANNIRKYEAAVKTANAAINAVSAAKGGKINQQNADTRSTDADTRQRREERMGG